MIFHCILLFLTLFRGIPVIAITNDDNDYLMALRGSIDDGVSNMNLVDRLDNQSDSYVLYQQNLKSNSLIDESKVCFSFLMIFQISKQIKNENDYNYETYMYFFPKIQ